MSAINSHSKQLPPQSPLLRCYTCLTSDRKLTPLRDKQLLTMLCPEMFFRAQPTTQYLICWECHHMIWMIKKFKEKVIKANVTLKLSLTKPGFKLDKGLSNLEVTKVEIITIAPHNVPPQSISPQAVPLPMVIAASIDPLKQEEPPVQIKLENPDISGDFDELIQPTTIKTSSTASSDPLLTALLRKPKTQAQLDIEVSTENEVKIPIAPSIQTFYRPQKVFINTPNETMPLRGAKEAVKVTGGIPNLVKGKEIVPNLKGKDIVPNLKGTEIIPNMKGYENILKVKGYEIRPTIKSKNIIDMIVPILVRGKETVPTLVKDKETVPNQKGTESVSLTNQKNYMEDEKNLGVYGYDQDEATCKLLNRNEMMEYRKSKINLPTFKSAKLKCEKCVVWYSSQKYYDLHCMKHDLSQGNSVCDVCEQRFPDDSMRDEHYKAHFVVYECIHCGFQHNNRIKISYHIHRSHEVSVFGCRKCSKTFKTYKEMRQHRKDHIPRQPCDECDKTFGTRPGLLAHKASTHRGVKYECTVCQKRVRNLASHMHLVHEDTSADREYCIDCGTTFKNKKSLEVHLSTTLKHNTVEQLGIKCEHCDKYFSSKNSLKDHIEHVIGGKYTCDNCNKDFTSKRTLARHISHVHGNKRTARRLKICEICGKSFSTKISLVCHMNAHLGLRPYVCQDCGATFSYTASLYTHRRLVHKVKRKYEMES